MKKLEPFRWRRLEVVRQYDQELSGLPGIRTLEDKIPGIFPHNYVIRTLDGRRDGLVQELAQRGIGSGFHFIPCHMQPLYAGGVHLPVTERLYEQIVSADDDRSDPSGGGGGESSRAGVRGRRGRVSEGARQRRLAVRG
ncbi:MAG: DegT/DnrJ/EryC1/StrS family aminotransferase [Bryobacteraceae bacterium]